MACSLTSGISLQCRDNIGGIDAIYILSGSVTSITDSAGAISNITGTGTFFKLNLQRGVGDYTETPTPSLENGTVHYVQTINVAFPKLDASLRNQVKVLAQSPDLKIVVQTSNGADDNVGKFFYVGRYRGATLTGGAATTGAAFSDANQYALTFEANGEPYPSEEITTTGELIDALTGITTA